MLLVAIAWMYVVLMMALAEASAPQGTVLGALITFVLYGVLPLALLLYLMGAPGRARALKAARQATAVPPAVSADGLADPDERGHAAGAPVPPVREVP